jgi:uncharacterized protein YndB with AHSA1/START domain
MKTAPALVLSALLPFSAAAQERVIQKQVVVKADVGATWQAWTTTEGIRTFFAPDGRIEARPLGPYEIYFNPYAKPGLKGADDMIVLAVQEKKMIAFTWNAPPSLPQVRGHRTHVAVRLRPVGDSETEVRITHSGWGEGGEWDQAYDYFGKAWDHVLGNLRKRFETGPLDWSAPLKRLKEMQEAEEAKAGGRK